MLSLMCLATSSFSQLLNSISPLIFSILALYGPNWLVLQAAFWQIVVVSLLSVGQDPWLEH